MGRNIRGVQTFIRFVQGEFQRATRNLWRGGLPPLGREATPGTLSGLLHRPD